jgi:DNA-binding transcriptional MerR regulator
MPDDPYTLGDLARLADVTPRTVRYYVAQGLLPSPEVAGPATRYGEGHLARLRLIRRLQRDHLPLAEIRGRLERMGDEEVVAAAEALDPQEPQPSLEASETLTFVRSLMRQAGVRPTVAEPPAALAPAASARPGVVLARGLAAYEMPDFAGPGPADPMPAAPMPAASVQAPMPAPPAQAMAPAPAPITPSPAAAPGPRTPPDRTTWERLVISPDVELHVRRPLDRQTNKRVDQLERIARELFEDP